MLTARRKRVAAVQQVKVFLFNYPEKFSPSSHTFVQCLSKCPRPFSNHALSPGKQFVSVQPLVGFQLIDVLLF